MGDKKHIGIFVLGPAIPILAVAFFVYFALVQGDVGFQVDKTQHGLLVSRVSAHHNQLKPGDNIVAIRGVPYHEALGYLLSSRPVAPGLIVTVQRDNLNFTTLLRTLPFTPGSMAKIAGPRLLLISFFFLLGIFARLRAPDSPQVRLFFLLLCGLATSVAATLGSCLSILRPAVVSLSFLLLTLSNWFSFGIFVHFALRFPSDRDLLVKKNWPLFLIYLVPPLVSISVSVYLGGLTPAFWGWLQRSRNIFLPVFIALVFIKAWRDYRQAQPPYDKRRLRPLLLVYWVSFGPYFFLYLLPNILVDHPLISFRLVTIFFLALPLAYFYGLIRYRLFDADRLLSRFVSYGILTGIILLIYSYLLTVTKRWLFGNEMLSQEMFLLFFVGSVITFLALQKRMERFVGKLFFGHMPVPEELLHQFSEKISGLLFLSEIVKAMVEELPKKINVDSVALMLLGKKHSRLFPENLRFGSSLWSRSNLVKQLQESRISYLKTDFTPSEEQFGKELKDIRSAGFSLVLPMRTATGLSGILFIGFRNDGRKFTDQDIHLMGAIANQGAIALQNARRHESLAESKRQIEELFNQKVQQEKMALVGEMTSMVAHELKNPLGIIHSSAQYLVDRARPPEVQKEMLQYIVDEVEHLNTSVESLLTMAKQPPPKFEQIDIAIELPELIQRWTKSSDHNPKVAIDCKIHPHLPTIYCDLKQLGQVVFNLIRNSEEMMPEGGRVLVEVELEDDQISIRVKDTGPGITETDRNNLFKSFFTTKEGGLGLGLVVCQQIVAAHKGQIGLDNGPSGGAVAWIKLPLRPLGASSKSEL